MSRLPSEAATCSAVSPCCNRLSHCFMAQRNHDSCFRGFAKFKKSDITVEVFEVYSEKINRKSQNSTIYKCRHFVILYNVYILLVS